MSADPGTPVKIAYHIRSDRLTIDFSAAPAASGNEGTAEGVAFRYGDDGKLVAIEISGASLRVDLRDILKDPRYTVDADAPTRTINSLASEFEIEPETLRSTIELMRAAGLDIGQSQVFDSVLSPIDVLAVEKWREIHSPGWSAPEATVPMPDQTSILLVDDDMMVAGLVSLMLQSGGYSVRTAGNGREALETHGETPADLIITDIEMPDMNGLDLIRELRKSSPETRIIGFSAGSDGKRNLAAAAEAGANATVAKPVNLQVLLDEVERVLAETQGEER